MKKILLTLVSCQIVAATAFSQIQFTSSTSLLTPANHYNGVAIAVTDVDGDGLDDIVRLNMGNQLGIEYQTAPGQPFIHQFVGEVTTELQWAICVADVDNNGIADVLSGGDYNGISLAMANNDGTAYDIGFLTEPGTFVQGMNFADINNDGWLDAFVCHDDGISRIFGNDGAGNIKLEPTWINLATVPTSDNSGNYGSVWCDVDNDGDLDLYIAKCRQGITDPADPMRINQLFLNNGDGTYKQDTDNSSGLRIGAQSWTADFGDIDNDGDFDCFITNHDVSSQLLLNDGSGHFTDITASAGLFNAIGGFPIQGVFRDFDNDGFTDIIVAGSVSYLFRNNGNKTFSPVNNLFDGSTLASFALGDLNHDGFQDVYACYGDPIGPTTVPDKLWFNVGNNNHFYGLNLRGIQSNRSAVGAKVLLYSALGVQAREVRAGESYGITNSMQIHFGLGQAEVDSVKVFWPSGTVDVLYQPGRDQYQTLFEGGCLTEALQLVADGPLVFCSGQDVVLSVPGDFAAYSWSNGDTTPSLTVTSPGTYSVTVTRADGCTVNSNLLKITLDPVETPLIQASGDSVLCGGASLTLSSTPAASYLWSTGDTTQNISVTASGQYSVTIQGLCATFTSLPYNILIIPNNPPGVIPDTIAPGQSALLLTNGPNASWYESPAGGIPLASGPSFQTPPLDANTTYWVENSTTYDPANQFAGMTNHQGSQIGDPELNGSLVFDCFVPFRLARVKVYANIAAERRIILIDMFGDEIHSKTVNIPTGESIVDLGFDVPAGKNFQLTTDQAVNQANLSTDGPQLWRSSLGVLYPYEIPGVLSIFNSNLGLMRYYYFYNWEIDYYAVDCVSERSPVTAVVDPSLRANAPEWSAGTRIYPNPTSGNLNVEIDNFTDKHLQVSLLNSTGATVYGPVTIPNADIPAFRVDVSAQPKGMYWLEMSSESGSTRRKIAIQ